MFFVRQMTVLFAVIVVLSGCGVTMPRPETLTAHCSDDNLASGMTKGETLFFASNRAPRCFRDGRLGFSGFRGTSMVLGTSTIPAGNNGWKQHASQQMLFPAWSAKLADSAALAGPDKPVIVYIHGYNNDFEDALQRGQILSRIAKPGTPVVVASWPSRSKFASYTYDEASAEWSTDAVEDLLRKVIGISDHVIVVAHSMGNRLAITAVMNLDRERNPLSSHIKQMVLASPDVDRDLAMRSDGVLDRLVANGEREVLVYTSSVDIANRASHRVHGFSRLGSTNCRFDINYARQRSGLNDCHMRVRAERLAIVDTGDVHSSGTRHSDFVDSCATRRDLEGFLNPQKSIELRAAMGTDKRGGWKIDRNRAIAEGVLRCARASKVSG